MMQTTAKPARLWPAAFIAGVALLGALLELAVPDGVYAEGLPVRLWIGTLGLPAAVAALASGLVRAWVTVATLTPVIGVGTGVGALLLAALNWRRMNQPHKAVVHVLLALVMATVPRAKLFAEGVYGGYVLVAVLHIGLAVYLYRAQQRDIAVFRAGAQPLVRRANIVAGVGIALFGAVLQSALSYIGVALAVQANQFLMSQAR